MNVFRAVLLSSAFVLGATAGVSVAAGGSLAGFNFGEWQISTGEFDFHTDTGEFSVPNHLTLTRPGSDISADRASGNQKQKFATLYGDVVLHDSQGSFAGIAGGGSRAPSTLTCAELQLDGVGKVYTAIGNVHFTQGGSQAYADRAVLNGMTHQLQLHGHVRLIQ